MTGSTTDPPRIFVREMVANSLYITVNMNNVSIGLSKFKILLVMVKVWNKFKRWLAKEMVSERDGQRKRWSAKEMVSERDG